MSLVGQIILFSFAAWCAGFVVGAEVLDHLRRRRPKARTGIDVWRAKR